MKKSEMYREAQKAVMNASNIPTEMRLDIVRLLMENEDLEEFREEREAAENGKL